MFQKQAAGWTRFVQQALQRAPRSRLATALTSAGQTATQAARRTASTAANAARRVPGAVRQGGQAVQARIQQGRQSLNAAADRFPEALRQATGTPANQGLLTGTARYVAGVQPGQPAFPNLRTGTANVVRGLVRPRYPGLDRAPGAVRGGRPLDRTRQALASGARTLAGATTLGSASMAGAAAYSYPEYVYTMLRSGPAGAALRRGIRDAQQYAPGQEDAAADEIFDHADAAYSHLFPEERRQAAIRDMRTKLLPDVALQMVGAGDPSPIGRTVGQTLRETAIPLLRNDLYGARERRPYLMNAIDAARSLTPAGLLATLAMRAAGSPVRPDIATTLRQNFEEAAPAIAQTARTNPEVLAASPYVQWFRNHWDHPELVRPAARGLLAPAEMVSPQQPTPVWMRDLLTHPQRIRAKLENAAGETLPLVARAVAPLQQVLPALPVPNYQRRAAPWPLRPLLRPAGDLTSGTLTDQMLQTLRHVPPAAAPALFHRLFPPPAPPTSF